MQIMHITFWVGKAEQPFKTLGRVWKRRARPDIATLSAEFGKEDDISCHETCGKIHTSHYRCGFRKGRRPDIVTFSARLEEQRRENISSYCTGTGGQTSMFPKLVWKEG
jgi:hypothetical protein